jgi:Kef-type K+ transport system membrane component KefB
MNDVLLTALDLALVVAVARGVGALAMRIGEPRIAGEMLGAILIGPTVLGGQIEGVVDGAQAAGLTGSLFPALAVDTLTWIGAVGMILYMLLVGLTIDPAPMGRRLGPILALVAATAGTMALLALIAAPWLSAEGGWKGPDATNLAFALALGAGLAAHGVPIAARILEERGLLRCEIGGIVIAAGACVTTLALIASGVALQGGDGAALGDLALIVAAAAVVVAIVAPLAHSPRMRLPPRVAVAVLLVIALAAGFGGKAMIGTVLIGPLVVGIVVRNGGFSAQFLERHLGDVVRGWLLPVFLGVAALHTNLRDCLDAIVPVVAILAAVVALKWTGSFAAARAAGFDRADASAIGALLQCGGVMTIAISLDVLQAGIITTRAHAMLTLAGLVTTALAGPLLARSGLGGREPPAEGAAGAVVKVG